MPEKSREVPLLIPGEVQLCFFLNVAAVNGYRRSYFLIFSFFAVLTDTYAVKYAETC